MAVHLEKIREMAERVVASEGLVLFDVEVKGRGSNQLLRIYIDKPEGVSHADCEAVSEQMSALLDIEDLFPGKYLLEVSSPGLDRQLVKPSDFEYFAGRRARIVLREPLDNDRVLEGKLAGLQSGRVRLDVGHGEIRDVDLAHISKARLVVEG
jgi:ribosome maturation factor RimP